MSSVTAKRKAKRILTEFIRQIADEQHNDPIITGPGINDSAVVTKAEALARIIWERALGYKHTIDIFNNEGKKIGAKEVIEFPDKHYIGVVLERLEGKVPNVTETEKEHKATAADRVTKMAKDRINKIAKAI